MAPPRAATAAAAPDPHLRGRTYAVPFERVWQAALALAGGRLRGWRVVDADDQEGVIRAEARRRFGRACDDVIVNIGLDADAQTRVDAVSSAREGWTDLGANARRLRRFFRALDRAVLPPVT